MDGIKSKMDVVNIVSYPDGRLDVNNAAKYLGITKNSLACLRSKRKGPDYIKRGHVFYYIEDLDKWLKESLIKNV